MRITNQMMINNSMANIQINKNQMNTMDTQFSTQKKISKPSEDPYYCHQGIETSFKS